RVPSTGRGAGTARGVAPRSSGGRRTVRGSRSAQARSTTRTDSAWRLTSGSSRARTGSGHPMAFPPTRAATLPTRRGCRGARRIASLTAMCHDADSAPPIPPISGASVSHEDLVLEAADGNEFAAFLAAPEEPGGAGVVILPDVRGLH